MFFFSSRRGHTRSALVPGVQTCALPILAKYSPAAAIAMGLFIVHLYWNVLHWPAVGPGLVNLATFARIPQADWIMVNLFAVAVAAGMLVVPLSAFLTPTVHRSEDRRSTRLNSSHNGASLMRSSA